ncbi:MAG: SDR family oxidoreductase [Kouleothrix sp.]|nr:SDR family oxidoreductase [Kouleothrix sp.]
MNRMTGLAFAAAAGATAVVAGRALRRQYDLRGKSVLITGGSRGLGLALARELADRGARLAIVARDRDELERARADIEARGAEVLAFPCDVREQRAAQQAVERTVARYGAIDVLINNAGIIQSGPIEHMQIADFEDALATHMWGPLYTMLAAAPHMREQGGGRIVNIASIGGKVAVPHLVPYTTSKFALVGLSDGMRAELAKDGIKVTTVCPGLMRTGSHVNSLFKGQHQSEFTWFSIIDSLPVSSIDAQRAARAIVDACRRGDPQLVVSVQAKAIALVAAALPNLTARGLKLMNWLLPGPAGAPDGDQARTGWESRSGWAPSLLTRLSDRATERYNGLKGHAPIV